MSISTPSLRLKALLLAVVLAWLPGLMPDSPRIVSAQSPSTGGPVVLMGIDAEEQAGVGSHPTPGDYTLLLDTMLGQVSNGGSGILVIGAGKSVCADSPDYSKVFWDAVDVNITTAAVTYVNGAAIAAQSFSGFKMIAVASSDIEIASGCGLTDAENETLVSRKNDIAAFVNGGGALLGFTATGLTNPYGYLAPFGSFAFTTGVNYNNITPTPAGTALGITDAAFDHCCWHDEFTAFPSFLNVLATNAGNTSSFPNPGTIGNAAAIGGQSVVVDEEKTATFDGETQQRVDFFVGTTTPISFLISLPGFEGDVTFSAEQTNQDELETNGRLVNFPDAQCSQIGPNGNCVEICALNPPVITCGPGDPTCVEGRFKWIEAAPYGNPQILHELSSVPGDAYDENATVLGTFNPVIDPNTPNDPVEDWESGGMSCWIVVDLPPFLTLPDDIVTVAASPDGAVVTFTEPTATTAASENPFTPIPRPDVTCASISGLTSGSTFPIGTTTVTCSATSDTGLTGTVSFDVTVLNAPPSGLVLNSGSINENDSFTLTGSFTDPDGQTHTVSINWGDGSSPTVLSLAPGVLEFSASHQYLDDNPTGTPSDTYTVDVTVTDAMGASTTGSTFVVVNNVAPVITGVTGPAGPLALGSVATVVATYTDIGTLDTHTCTFAWDDGSSNTEVAGAGGSCSAAHIYATAGVYTVGVTVTDDDSGAATSTFQFVVVYDPSAGFVTGGGWINSPAGAYTPNPSLTGKANFGFVSKYQKGATVPTGQTQFQLHSAGFNFHSSVYEVLVVSGHKAQYRGSGTVNGGGDYGFRLTAYDGQVSGGDGLDKFRIKIWDKATNVVIYDNRLGSSDDIDTADPQVIGGGSIVIHTGK